MTNKEEFISIVKKNITRDGIDNLLTYLEESGFYKCPASTRYHGSYEGGLLDHSLNVYYSLIEELKFIFGNDWQKRYSLESVTIVSLFHDLCKIGKYEKGFKNVKNEDTGVWEKVETFQYNKNCFTMGHAPLSLQRINKFIVLTDEESQAIYWHMGAFDLSQYSDVGQLGESFSKNTLAFALHMADMTATYVCENEHFKPIEIE